MTKALLTSRGITPPATASYVKSTCTQLDIKTCALIYTAAESPESKFVMLAKEQLEQLNITVTLLDAKDITNKQYDMVYIAGGNTFKLLHDIRSTVGEAAITQLITSAKLTIGVSAGAILLTPSIEIAEQVLTDVNTTGLTNHNGLNLVDFEFLPHYDDSLAERLDIYKKSHQRMIITCTNDNYLEVSL